MDKHNCDNVNCNHNNTKGLCCLFNPENCKYRQLQKENAELKKACDETQELLDKQIEVTYELDKENAELKEKREQDCDSSWYEGFNCSEKERLKQLTKAKDHIKKLLDCLKQDTNDLQTNYYVCQYMDKAEQFLSEVEK